MVDVVLGISEPLEVCYFLHCLLKMWFFLWFAKSFVTWTLLFSFHRSILYFWDRVSKIYLVTFASGLPKVDVISCLESLFESVNQRRDVFWGCSIRAMMAGLGVSLFRLTLSWQKASTCFLVFQIFSARHPVLAFLTSLNSHKLIISSACFETVLLCSPKCMAVLLPCPGLWWAMPDITRLLHLDR